MQRSTILLAFLLTSCMSLELASLGNSEEERLETIYQQEFEYTLREFPEFATSLGMPGDHHRWTDQSIEAIKQRNRQERELLQRVKGIDREALSPDQRINYDIFLRRARRQVEGQKYFGELMPVNQMGGIQQSAASTLARMPRQTLKHYQDILGRLESLPRSLAQTVRLMQAGLARGYTPPRVTMQAVPGQVLNQIPDDPAQAALLKPFREFPDSMPAAQQQELKDQAEILYRENIVPAFRRFHEYLTTTYIPGCRESIGASSLPNGEEFYNWRVRGYTTTDLSAQEIHEIGLSEVKRIRGEMDQVIRESGFEGSFEEFTEFLRTDPQFYFDTPEELLAAYRDICKRADPELAKVFGRMPRLPYGVIAVPAYAEKSQTTAYYQSGSQEAGRPGYFFANTYDLKSRPKWEMEALSLHEAVPGHHFQITLAQELPELPWFRRFGGVTAFVEGWGLYSESLGQEMGFYKDPYSKFGQLTYEMWRAIRLVVDTGMHSLGWSREQAIGFFVANSAKTRHDIEVEIDRYIVWPGQALAYKIGELKIKELRAFAERELGSAFDIRDFHDTLLGAGALPLNVLEARMKAWVEHSKAENGFPR